MTRLENEGGSKSRRNEQVARSEAECQMRKAWHNRCLPMGTVAYDGGEEGASPPSFLVLNKDNVNAQLHKAQV